MRFQKTPSHTFTKPFALIIHFHWASCSFTFWVSGNRTKCSGGCFALELLCSHDRWVSLLHVDGGNYLKFKSNGKLLLMKGWRPSAGKQAGFVLEKCRYKVYKMFEAEDPKVLMSNHKQVSQFDLCSFVSIWGCRKAASYLERFFVRTSHPHPTELKFGPMEDRNAASLWH